MSPVIPETAFLTSSWMILMLQVLIYGPLSELQDCGRVLRVRCVKFLLTIYFANIRF